MKERMPSYGGQAVIEGVLMRGQTSVAMANRTPEGEIVVKQEKLTGIYTTNIRKIPFLRGLILLWDSLGLGMHFLTESANIQTGEEEKLEGPALVLTLVFSLVLGVGIFFLLPALISGLLEKVIIVSPWVTNLFEGVLRLVILVVYLWAIGKMPEIERVFMYHGAEHKTINAFEDNAELTPEVVKKYSLEHPRCGTSFILTLVLLSIIVFSLLGPLSLLLMIPVIAGIAYEYIKFMANHLESPIVKVMIKPNLALQRLTTREPSEEMLEVSIKAFTTMYAMEQTKGEEIPVV